MIVMTVVWQFIFWYIFAKHTSQHNSTLKFDISTIVPSLSLKKMIFRHLPCQSHWVSKQQVQDSRSGSLPPEPVLFVCSFVFRACVFWPIRHRQRDKWQQTFFRSRNCFTHMLSFHSILTSQRKILWLAAFYRWGHWCSEFYKHAQILQLVNSRVGIYSRASRLLCLLTRKWKNLQELKANFCFKSLSVVF